MSAYQSITNNQSSSLQSSYKANNMQATTHHNNKHLPTNNYSSPRATSKLSVLSLVMASVLGMSAWGSISDAYAANNGLPVIDKQFNATLKQAGSRLTVTSDQGKNNALLIWKSFDVNQGKTVAFDIDGYTQNTKPVSFLNVVSGPGRSNIDGSVIALKKHSINFYLINPNGIRVSESGNISSVRNVYLGTHKVSQKTLDSFKNGNAPAIELNALPSTKGMGKVALIGAVTADQLKVNGSQIVIADSKRLLAGGKDQSIELHSSTNRIDVGGDMADKAGFEKRAGLKGVSKGQLKASGEHDNGEYVDHFGQTAIYSMPDANNPYKDNNFADIEKDLQGNYWLADDLVLDMDNRLKGDQAFSGSLDGAFHTIKLTGELKQDGKVASNDYGALGKLENAQIANLKVVSDELIVNNGLKDQKVNLGALAGSIKDSSLHNVEVVDFSYRFEQDLVHAEANLGALAGKMEGNNKLSNVVASYSTKTQDCLANEMQQGKLNHVGALVGNNQGNIDSNLMVAGISMVQSQSTLNAVGFGTNFGISNSYQGAYENAMQALMAKGMNQDQASSELNSVFALSFDNQAQGATLSSASIKGFLKPFFIEDFNFMYDGKAHNYESLVNNEGFKLESVLNKTNGLNYEQKDAGNYGFIFDTRAENLDLGHAFYFSYQFADDTWDRNQGGAPALQDRTHRVDSLLGVGTLNINKKTLALDLKDQVIEHDGKPNLEINRDTVANFDQVLGSLVHGDKLDDLHLSLQVNGTQISAVSHSKNYEVTIHDAVLTKKPVPQPQPQPNPNPDPTPVPNPDQKPDWNPEFKPESKPEFKPIEPDFRPDQKPNEDSNKNFADLVGSQSKCQNCSHYDKDRFDPFAWVSDHSYMTLSGMDFTQAIFASLKQDNLDSHFEVIGNNELDYSLAYNDYDLTMSTTDTQSLIEHGVKHEISVGSKLTKLAMDIKLKAEYVISMLKKQVDDRLSSMQASASHDLAPQAQAHQGQASDGLANQESVSQGHDSHGLDHNEAKLDELAQASNEKLEIKDMLDSKATVAVASTKNDVLLDSEESDSDSVFLG